MRLLENLGARRQKYSTKLYAEVRQLRSVLRKDLTHMAAVFDKLAHTRGDSSSGTAGGPKAAGAAVSLAVQLAVPQRLGRTNLHPYRLKVKELRNLLQTGAGDNTRFIDDLARVKDAIGEWHDWEVLLSIAQEELDHGNRCELVAELKRITGRKYDFALALANALRRTYLRTAHPRKKRSSTASSSIPRGPVWEAIATLAS